MADPFVVSMPKDREQCRVRKLMLLLRQQKILAQKDSNPTIVALLLSLESVFAVIAGAVVLHQQMTAREYLGCVLMFAAVVLAQIPMPQKKEAKAE